MFKMLLFSLGLLFSTHAFSQNYQTINCQSSAPKIHVQVTESPIEYQTNYWSSQLPATHYHEFFTLGTFKPSWTIQHRANIRELRYGSQSCGLVTDVYLEVNFIPTIYIAKEAQQYACTYQRVLNHERTHYSIERRAFALLAGHIENIAQQYYGNVPASFNHNINFDDYLKQQSQYFNQDISNIVNQNSQPYHQQLDTPENYRAESNMCSQQENILLFQTLRH